MKHFISREQIENDPEIEQRLWNFVLEDDKDFFEEVRSRLSPEDLTDFLEENPEYKKYFNNNS